MKEETNITVNGYALDSEQLKPVLENKKYSLIIAGAGSGKTLTLIGKIKYLLENNIYQKEEICCISFTNETTNNLKTNILKNCNKEVDVFTFHKLALKILKENNINFKISNSNLLEKITNEFFITKCFENKTLQNIIFKKFKIHIFKNNKNWNKILNSKELKSYIKTILTFINLMKSNGYTKKELISFLQTKKHKNILLIIYTIYTIYETEKNSQNLIDFDDMLSLSTKVLKENKSSLPYKLIIIDEFQDTSLCRFKLINEIIKQNDASLCVVGDDYQSIYKFSGCNLDLFLNFKNYFKDVSTYKLEKTYRNSQQLIETSGSFIMKNPNQIKKKLRSPKSLEKPIIITYYKSKKNILEKIIEKINQNDEILIIGRNNFDLKLFTNNLKYKELENNYLEFEKFKNRKIRYLTIHTSKGLESDIVILLNNENSLYGLPTKLKDEKVLSLIKNKDEYPFAEERRLFYVALTRTKTKIYLLTPKENPSIFIKEIKNDKNVKIINL